MSKSRKLLVTSALLAVTAPATALLASPAQACTPSYSGYGPTVYVQPDYAHPLQSDVGYDSSDFQITVNPCSP